MESLQKAEEIKRKLEEEKKVINDLNEGKVSIEEIQPAQLPASLIEDYRKTEGGTPTVREHEKNPLLREIPSLSFSCPSSPSPCSSGPPSEPSTPVVKEKRYHFKIEPEQTKETSKEQSPLESPLESPLKPPLESPLKSTVKSPSNSPSNSPLISSSKMPKEANELEKGDFPNREMFTSPVPQFQEEPGLQDIVPESEGEKHDMKEEPNLILLPTLIEEKKAPTPMEETTELLQQKETPNIETPSTTSNKEDLKDSDNIIKSEAEVAPLVTPIQETKDNYEDESWMSNLEKLKQRRKSGEIALDEPRPSLELNRPKLSRTISLKDKLAGLVEQVKEDDQSYDERIQEAEKEGKTIIETGKSPDEVFQGFTPKTSKDSPLLKTKASPDKPKVSGSIGKLHGCYSKSVTLSRISEWGIGN